MSFSILEASRCVFFAVHVPCSDNIVNIDLHFFPKVGVIWVKKRLEEMGARDEIPGNGFWGWFGKDF